MTWIWIQSSTPLTFKLPGAAYDISSRCLYRGRLLWLSGVSRRGRKEAAVVPRPLGNREPFGDSKPFLPALNGWRSHLHSEETPQILSFLLECEAGLTHP